MVIINPWTRPCHNLPPFLSASITGSLSNTNMKNTNPAIIQYIIDHMEEQKESIVKTYGPEVCDELNCIIQRLKSLKQEIVCDRRFARICDDACDTKMWNDCIDEFQNHNPCVKPSWFSVPVLFADLYMYRRVIEAFSLGCRLQHYDPYQHSKQKSFHLSIQPMKTMANYFFKNIDSKNQSELLDTLLQVSLWSNKCDLSLTAGKDSPQKLDPLKQIIKFSDNVIVNKIDEIESYLFQLKANITSSIDFAVDNSGFEIFSDLLLADFLTMNGYCKFLRLHVKDKPWIISDVTKCDLEWLLCTMSNSSEEVFKKLAERWRSYIDCNKWIVCADPFWTSYHPYYCMESVAPDLYESFCKSALLIFKGDLHYRRLISDCQWDYTTSFQNALLGFEPVPVIAIRTIKEECVVGLKPGEEEKLCKIDEKWMHRGEYGVIQFSPY